MKTFKEHIKEQLLNEKTLPNLTQDEIDLLVRCTEFIWDHNEVISGFKGWSDNKLTDILNNLQDKIKKA